MDTLVDPAFMTLKVMATSSRIWWRHKEAASMEPGIPLDSIGWLGGKSCSGLRDNDFRKLGHALT